MASPLQYRLCLEAFYRGSDTWASSFVAAVFPGVQPRTIERTMQRVGKDVKRTRFFRNLTLTALAIDKIVEVVGAVGVDVLCQLFLVNFDCFHSHRLL